MSLLGWVDGLGLLQLLGRVSNIRRPDCAAGWRACLGLAWVSCWLGWAVRVVSAGQDLRPADMGEDTNLGG